MYRVKTIFTGPLVTGGGISQLYFAEGGGSAENAASAVAEFWEAMAGVMSSQVTITVSGEVELVSSSTGQVTGLEATDNVSFPGLSTGDPLPPATQALIR